MRCPFCDQDKDKVVDSRASDGGRTIRRRRECLACGKRFTTREAVEETVRMTVIKRDGSRVPFDPRKILAGLEKACFKRPVSAVQLEELVASVEEELFRSGEREIPGEKIGQIVSSRLKDIDQVAYVRFASVYKQFRDLDDLLEEVRDVIEHNEQKTPGQGELF